MINNEDVLLSKMSYTDKDFASLYPDLLDLAKQLTNKWDPSLSNESDPGVVLLKEGAFIADHNNYNIDKNVLENFLPSATQDRSVRNIVEMNGYVPRYYVSATGKINFTFNPDDEYTGPRSFTIPKFTISITNTENNVVYTQLEDLRISNTKVATPCTFIEGSIEDLTVNDSYTILLENIDENNRVYFPHPFVAQNGVFIRNVPKNDESFAYSDLWERDNYLLTKPLGSKVYKIDFDSALNLPFIEFPSDIANIIGNGLEVKYISTNGARGNVRANSLNTIKSPTEYVLELFGSSYSVDMSKFTVNNSAMIINGKDPETIDEMYRSFKRIVGTFNTLVTCKDYANAIYMMTGSDDNPLISNVQVTDRRTDYNNSLNVITYDKFGEYFENITLNTVPSNPQEGDMAIVNGQICVWTIDSETQEGEWVEAQNVSYADFVNVSKTAMNLYSLCIYALNRFSLSDYSAIESKRGDALNNSFKPAPQTTLDEIIGDPTYLTGLHEYKCLSHEFKTLDNKDVFCFKNYVPLYVTIIPYSKVTLQEREQIINNVWVQLSTKFNARLLEFGEELNYDEVVDEIIAADPRIKDIRMQDFEYRPAVMFADGTEENLYSSEEYLVDLVAKNVLAGRMCLLDIDEVFTYRYGQQNNDVYNNIVELSSEVDIPFGGQLTSTSQKETKVTVDLENNPYIGDTIKLKIVKDEDLSGPEVKSLNQTISPNTEYVLRKEVDSTTGEITYADKLIIISGDEEIATITHSNYDKIVIANKSENNIIFENNNTPTVGVSDINVYGVEVNSEGYGTVLDYTLKDNEYILIAYPSYNTSKIYPTYCYYRFDTTGGNVAYKDSDYELQAGDVLTILYTKDDVQKVDTYKAGDVIRPTFNLYQTDDLSPSLVKKDYIDSLDTPVTAKFNYITGGNQIEIRELLTNKLVSASVPCYWSRNISGNVLFEEYNPEEYSTTDLLSNELYNKTWTILGSNEYFIYSNSAKDALVILGPGTRISRSAKDYSQWAIPGEAVSLPSINNNGVAANIPWRIFDFTEQGVGNLVLNEMTLLTLGKDNNIKIANWAEAPEKLDNNWVKIDTTINDNVEIEYTINKTTSKLRPVPGGYLIRSRLDLSMDNDNGQRLLENQKITILYNGGSDSATLKLEDTSEATPMYIQSSTPIENIGDQSINLNDYLNAGYNIGFMTYNIELPKLYANKYVRATGDVDTNKTYYVFDSTTGKYVEWDSTAALQAYGGAAAEVLTNYSQFGALEAAVGAQFYESKSEEEGRVINETNGKYVVIITSVGKAEFPMVYRGIATSDESDGNSSSYIIPVLFNRGTTNGVDIKVTATGKNEEGATVNVGISEFGKESSSNNTSFTLSESDMYLLKLEVPEQHVAEGEDPKPYKYNIMIKFEWDSLPTAQSFTVFNPVISDGINDKLSGGENGENIPAGAAVFTFNSVLDRINALIENSDNPNVKPYLIYQPDKSIAIEDENIYNPNILWDKNNVANIITIPQIDYLNSRIDIIKSMRDYSTRVYNEK